MDVLFGKHFCNFIIYVSFSSATEERPIYSNNAINWPEVSIKIYGSVTGTQTSADWESSAGCSP